MPRSALQYVLVGLMAWCLMALSPYGQAYAQVVVRNDATVQLPSGVRDDNIANNASTAEATVLPRADVRYKASTNFVGNPGAGDSIDYTITVIVTHAPTDGVVILEERYSGFLQYSHIVESNGIDCGNDAASSVLTCVLPSSSEAGEYYVTYRAKVLDTLSGTITNTVTATGVDNPLCAENGTCTLSLEPRAAVVQYSKTSDLSAGQAVKVGDVITYTLKAEVLNSMTTEAFVFTDVLQAGLTAQGTAIAPDFESCVRNGQELVCTLGAGKALGTYVVTYEAKVNAGATSSNLKNSVTGSGSNATPDPTACPSGCEVDVTLANARVLYAKSVDLTSGAKVKAGDVITYTLTAEVLDAMTTEEFRLTDTMGPGLTFGSVTDAGRFTCSGALICILPVGTPVGRYDLIYTATVNNEAKGSLTNAVQGTGSGAAPAPGCETNCEVIIEMEEARVVYSKTSNIASGTTVKAGDTITYRLTAEVLNSATKEEFKLTDTMGQGLALGEVVDAGRFVCSGSLECSLPAGTPVGVHQLVYTAVVTPDAPATLHNSVVGTGSGSEPAPGCTTDCEVVVEVEAPYIRYAIQSDVPEGRNLRVGDVITYTITTTVVNGATRDDFTLTNSWGEGLEVEVFEGGASTMSVRAVRPKALAADSVFTCTDSNPLVCVMPTGTPVGTYNLVYRATVVSSSAKSIVNTLTATGSDQNACDPQCVVTLPLASAEVKVSKTSNASATVPVEVGQTVEFSLNVEITQASINEDLVLVDTPSAGLSISAAPQGCVLNSQIMTCTVPSGTAEGTHVIRYQATIVEAGVERVSNTVTASMDGDLTPECVSCTVELRVGSPVIRLIKTASVRDVKVGDMVRYSLTVENVGTAQLMDAVILDTPAAGFTYVEGSLQVTDDDNFATVTGNTSIRIAGLDVQAGQKARVTYLMRVGASVGRGVHQNTAYVVDNRDREVSNRAQAEVELVADPMSDEALIFGTIFHDRDGDGWQDSASLSQVQVQLNGAATDFVPGSLTVDRGQGVEAQTDGALRQGLNLGDLAGRATQGAEAATVVIRHLSSSAQIGEGFTLTTKQGLTVKVDASGATRIETSGDAARGLTAGEIEVTRTIKPEGGNFLVEYVIRNLGLDERGLPGVRIGTVEGLLVMTDQYGRFHLQGVEAGLGAMGRNFIMKVDPVTLPRGAEFTTENPVVRRVTPGMPTRFDWGVRLPSDRAGSGGIPLTSLETGPLGAGIGLLPSQPAGSL